MEEWKDIKGFEGVYQISSEGKVLKDIVSQKMVRFD